MKKPQFVEGQFYHIYNRGVEKRVIFPHKNDYFRFISGLSEFNDVTAVILRDRLFRKGSTFARFGDKKEKEPLVRIHGFCLMPNHYHFLIEQLRENGISLFMQKLGTGYSMYINLKNDRVGPLFQGTFKAKLIDDEIYLTHVLRYIHLNPVDLTEPDWKEKGIKNWKRVKEFLSSYKWSSFNDYNGNPIYPDIVYTKFLLELLDGPKGHQEFIEKWVTEDYKRIDDLIIE